MAEYIDRNLIEWYGCNFEEPSCENRECLGCSHANCSHSQVMQIPLANVIPIPEGATNGDMIKAMFPNCEVREIIDDLVHYTLDGYVGQYATKDWWDAKYREVEE